MGMLKEVMQNASTISASIDPCCRTNRIPCFRLPMIDSVVFAGRYRAVIMESEMTGARKEIAFRPKHQDSPSLASACPASAGPIVTAVLHWIEFSAMAFGLSSLLTRVGIRAEYAGPPNACARPAT